MTLALEDIHVQLSAVLKTAFIEFAYGCLHRKYLKDVIWFAILGTKMNHSFLTSRMIDSFLHSKMQDMWHFFLVLQRKFHSGV